MGAVEEIFFNSYQFAGNITAQNHPGEIAEFVCKLCLADLRLQF
jgi:hypothetical protein